MTFKRLLGLYSIVLLGLVGLSFAFLKLDNEPHSAFLYPAILFLIGPYGVFDVASHYSSLADTGNLNTFAVFLLPYFAMLTLPCLLALKFFSTGKRRAFTVCCIIQVFFFVGH